MKKLFVSLCIVGVVLSAMAATNFMTITRDVKISNSTTNEPGLFIQKSATQSTNIIEAWNGGVLKFSVSSNGVVAKASMGLLCGTVITAADGTVTNTFSRVFSNAPIVVSTPFSTTTVFTNYITSITPSNFVLKCGAANITNKWIASEP